MVILLLLLLRPPTAGAQNSSNPLLGFWNGAGEYLYVYLDEGGKVKPVSSIPELRGSVVVLVHDHVIIKNKLGHDIARFTIHSTAFGADSLDVHLRSGRQLWLRRPVKQRSGLLNLFTTYTIGSGNSFIIMPDNTFWMVQVAIVIFAFMGIFSFLGNPLKMLDEEGCVGTLFMVSLSWSVPFFPAAIICGIKWLLWGWWDALLVGRIFIGTILIIPLICMLVALGFLVNRIRNFKDSYVGNLPGILRIGFFYLLIVVDIVSLISTATAFVSLFRGK